MTIGERNKAIMRKIDAGFTEEETAEYVGTTKNVVAKIVAKHKKDGDKVFESTTLWDGTDDDVLIQEKLSHTENKELDSLRYGKKIELRRMSIRKGQMVSFVRSGKIMRGEVIEEPRDWDRVIQVRVSFVNGNSYVCAPMIDDILRADRGEVE